MENYSEQWGTLQVLTSQLSWLGYTGMQFLTICPAASPMGVNVLVSRGEKRSQGKPGICLIWTGFVMDPASPLVTWKVSILQFLGTILRIVFCLVTRHTPAVSADPETTESQKSRTQKWILSHGQVTDYAQTTPIRQEPQELWWQKLHKFTR